MCAPVQSEEFLECRCCRPLNFGPLDFGQGLVLLTNRSFFGGPRDWASNRITFASYNELAKKSDPIVKDIHDKQCTRITQDGGDFRVVILDKHAYNECKNWFPKENVINDGIFLH